MARKLPRPIRRVRRRTDINVTRSEFNLLTDTVNKCVHTLDVQFRRIAQIQAELDDVRRAVAGAVPRKRHPR